jgi:Uma2 family endonuclease
MLIVTSFSNLDLTKQYSYADYLSWQFSERIELLKGYIRKMAAPTPFHQEVRMELSTYFKNYLDNSRKPCKLFAAPFDVRLYNYAKSVVADKDIYTVVQPDLCVICDKSKIDQRGCLGYPDFIIEILSESNLKTDLQDKYALYEENGVGEYWIVFPVEKMIQKFLLVDNKYQIAGIFMEHNTISPTLFPDLEIDLQKVFEEI